MSKDNLLPCAHCGSTDVKFSYTNQPDLGVVFCRGCYIQTSSWNKEKAIEVWNRRETYTEG